jgi:hypothetical protein
MAGIVHQLDKIDAEMKRLSTKQKVLRDQKKKHIANLITFMEKNKLESIGDYTLEKLKKGSTKPKLKPKAERMRDVYQVLNNIGVSDPVSLWDMLQVAQRMQSNER